MRLPHIEKDQADDDSSGGGLTPEERQRLATVRWSPEMLEHAEQERRERRRMEFARWLFRHGRMSERFSGEEHEDG